MKGETMTGGFPRVSFSDSMATMYTDLPPYPCSFGAPSPFPSSFFLIRQLIPVVADFDRLGAVNFLPVCQYGWRDIYVFFLFCSVVLEMRVTCCYLSWLPFAVEIARELYRGIRSRLHLLTICLSTTEALPRGYRMSNDLILATDSGLRFH